MVNTITAVAKAVEKGFALWGNWLKGKDKRKLEACKDAAKHYIRIAKPLIAKYIPANKETKKKIKLLKSYDKKFFRYT